MPGDPTLLLFDVDGTLVFRASREHAAALREALQVVHGLTEEQMRPRPRHHAAGRTEGEIARTILVDAGVDARTIDERTADVMALTCERYAELCPADLSGH